MYSYHRNIDILFENLNEDLITLNRWLSANKLVLNISKTNYMIFGDRDIPDHLKLSIDNNDLNQASEVTFLGLIIDKKLTFKGHISEVKTKLSKTLGIFRKLKFLPSTTLRNLYLSLVYPKFIYCIQSWGAASPTNLNKLIVMQKKFIRIISKTDYYAHTSPLFKNLNLLKLNDIFKYFTLIYMYKALNLNKYPSFLAALQNCIATHNHSTRQLNRYRLPFYRNDQSKQSLLYNTIKFWIELSDDIKTSLSLNIFKSKLYKSIILSY